MANSDLVQALLRGLDILALISDRVDGVRVNEVAEALSVKPPTAHNLLRTLQARNMVEKKRNKYVLGGGVFELASRRRQSGLIDGAEAQMKELAARYPSATLTFAQFIAGDLKVRLRISPDRPGRIQRPENQNFHPYINASGILFQAFADGDALEALLDRYPFDEYGALNWKSYSRFEKEIQAIKRRGHALKVASDGRSIAVAVPVVDDDQRLVATLGMRLSVRDGKGDADYQDCIDDLMNASKPLVTIDS